MRPDALVPTPFAVQPTPVYEFLFALALAWWLWKRQEKPQPLGYITGEYLVLSGIARFLVEFVRINPHVYGPFTNAQVAAAITVLFGGGDDVAGEAAAGRGDAAVAIERGAGGAGTGAEGLKGKCGSLRFAAG